MKKAVRTIRWICIAAWIAIPAACLTAYLYEPANFTAPSIAAFMLRFEGEALAVYFVLSALRGFSLLPSTPLVIAGTILFPQQPFVVLLVSMAGILLSSSMIYFFSEFLGFDDYFEDHKPELTHKIKAKLEHPLGGLFVALWAFIPFVPTDLVCYLAGTVRMDFKHFIAAVAAGELVLCCLYIFFGGGLIDLIR